jgi:hypothetical protein
MSLKPAVQMPKTDREYQKWCLDSGDTRFITGTGDPTGVHVANRGTLFLRTDGAPGSTLYIKDDDDGLATGWTAV